MFRQKLFKRVMPMLLSIAMVLQTIPATVYAAEPDTVTEAKESDAAVVDESAEGTDGGENVSMPDGSEASNPIGASDGIEPTEAADEGDTPAAAVPQAWFQLSLDTYANSLYGYTFDYTTSLVEAKYVKENPAYAAAVKAALTNALTIYVGDDADDSLKDQLKYKWKKYAGDAFADMAAGAEPHDVGLYALEVSLDAAAGKYSAAEPVMAGLEVQPAPISLNVEDHFAPGSTVKEVKDANKEIDVTVQGASAALADYVQSVTWSVEYAHADEDNGELAADTARLQKNKDYMLVANATLKDATNYTLEQNRFQIYLGEAVDTEIVVTYAAEGSTIGKVYDGTGFAFSTEKPEYTAKVVYTAADGTQQELAGAELQTSWCNVEKQEYADPKFVPTNAGGYYYKLSYTDENGTYADSEAYVRVDISMVDIVVDPQPLTEEQKAYAGMTAAEVLKNVTYKVYRVQNGVVSTEAEKIDEYFWGTAYSQNLSKEQSYAPVFALEKGIKDADGKVTWNRITNNSERLEKSSDEVSYRIVFTGQKTLYDTNGRAGTLLDVNNAQGNFCVDTTDAAIETYAETVQVLPSTKVVIDPSGIPVPAGAVEDGTNDGSDLSKPIVKIYDGESLYDNKGVYKKAVVKAETEGGSVPANADSMLVYTWQRTRTYNASIKEDEQGKVFVEESSWIDQDYNYHNVEVTASPYASWLYRLKITLEDPSNEFYAEPVYRYYVIQPQDVVAVLSGAPEIYPDGRNTIEDLLYNLQYSYAENKDTYVKLDVYPVTLTKGADGKAVVTKGETPLQNSYVSTLTERAYYSDPTSYFYVERKVTEGDNAGTWVRCNQYQTFEKDVEYRLCIDDYAYTNRNYNMGQEMDLYNRVVNDDYYPNESVAITCKATEAKEVTISLDETKITGNVKTYDGKTFENLDALKALVKVTTVADNADVTEAVKDKLQWWLYNEDLELLYLENEWEEGAVHAGNYIVYMVLQTDETYKYAQYVLETPYVIEKATLTVTPRLRKEIPAGLRLYGSTPGIGDIVESYEVTGYAECDKEAGDKGKVLEMTSWNIHERTASGTTNYNGILKSTEVYYVLGGDCDIDSRPDGLYPSEEISYGDDYEIKSAQMSFVPVRQAAEVGGEWVALKDKTEATESGYSHTVTADEGIPYSYDGDAVVAAGKTGNYFLFNLYAPGDFWEIDYPYASVENMGFIYQNRIEQAKGFVLGTGWSSGKNGCYRPYITVAFDASNKVSSTFEVVWGEDYVESYTIDLKNCILEADFREAVAPKSIAFNKASTKMVVGESQQLDVKLTKSQMNDIILLGYSSSNPAVLEVSESGFVTALAASKSAVTIEVYPCRLVDGVKTPIDKAKHAKVSIKVSEVTAPKISKVAAQDLTATVSYKKPADGYRREIYVLEGKKSVQQFEDTIAEVRNGDLSAFVYTQFVTGEGADKKGVASRTVENLLPTTSKASEYTVYVRNVAGLRKLDNGAQVAASHAGTVKTFKTIKAQAVQVDVFFDASLKGQTAKSYSYFDEDDEEYIHSAPLSAKSATVSVKAKFFEKYSKGYSDEDDYIWRNLSSAADAKDVKKNYTLPKMAYYVTEDIDGGLSYSGWSSLSAAEQKNYFYYGGYYYEKAAIASIDKKGKISFKGKGKIYIIAVDTNTGLSDVIKLFITASPTAATCKAIKMIPGQTINLASLLNYQEGKTKIVDYGRRYGNLKTTQISNADFRIEEDWTWDDGRDYAITALKPGAKLELTVTDSVVAANGGNPIKVQITTSAVEPVKSLKASEVYDDRFTVTFSYPEEFYEFRVELKDARGRVVYNRLGELFGNYDTKTKKYVYELPFNDNYFTGEVITRLSNYTVAVTAVCGGVSSKEVKTKVKTTNIPASYKDLSATEYGGCDIEVNAGNDRTYINLSSNPVLKTGNAYTLSIDLSDGDSNQAAKDRMTDTLTWKSSNTKVATVKANAGSYTAMLKTVNQGETTITVTSRITKKVIARRTVRVSATGEANGYFGDNEPYNEKADIQTVLNTRDVLEVTADNSVSVTLNAYEEQWFVFTAPAYGSFSYYSSYGCTVYNEEGDSLYSASNTMLEKGTKRYFRLQNNNNYSLSKYVSVSFTPYQEIVLGENRVKAGRNVVFKAPEDNYYTFTKIDGDSREQIGYAHGMSKDDTYSIYVSGTSGKEYTILVTKREVQDVAVGTKDLAVTLNADEEKWFRITPDEANVYKISFTDATGTVNAWQYASLADGYYQKSSTLNSLYEPEIADIVVEEAGEPFYIRLTAPNATADAPVTLKLNVTKRETQDVVAAPEGLEVKIEEAAPMWLKFTADETNVYRIYANESTASVDVALYEAITSTNYSQRRIGTPFGFEDLQLDEGESVYLCLTPDHVTENDLPITLKLHVEKREAQDLVVGAEGLDLTLEGYEEKWFRISAEEAMQEVTITVADNGWVGVSCYANLTDMEEMASRNSREVLLVVPAGTVYYIRLSVMNPSYETPTLTIHKKDCKVLEELPLGTKEITGLVPGDAQWYSYTAADDGIIDFAKQDASSTGIGISFLGSTSPFLDTPGSGTESCYMNAGETMLLKVYTTNTNATADAPDSVKLVISRD